MFFHRENRSIVKEDITFFLYPNAYCIDLINSVKNNIKRTFKQIKLSIFFPPDQARNLETIYFREIRNIFCTFCIQNLDLPKAFAWKCHFSIRTN